MKKPIQLLQLLFIFVCLLCLGTGAYAQIQSGAYRGNLLEEYVWSRTKDDYIMVDKISMTTKIVFTDTHIYFKKGPSDWRQNLWTFDKKEKFPNGRTYDVYHDEREQQVLIDYQNSEILYYYNWDIHTQKFANVAMYKNLEEDSSILKELSIPTSEKFRMDYNHVAIFDKKKDEWGDWKKGTNSFVININDNGDIMHIKASGDKVIYKRTSGVEKGQTNDGKRYQIISALDNKGSKFRFQIFDDEEVGLKLIYGDVMIQFAKL